MNASPILEILSSIHSAQPCLPPTLLYNEGWLLRLVLHRASRAPHGSPLEFEPGARWFSEALLYSAFLPRRRGDPLAESCTHADGVIGHFDFHPESKAGLMLDPRGTQFVVCEAKMFSPLSKGTARAPGFDQAARNIACMAETLRRARKPVSRWQSLKFLVIAPEAQVKSGLFASETSKESVRRKIAARVAGYEPEVRCRLEVWQREWAEPLVEAIEIRCLAWEDLIDRLGDDLREFYACCLRYNSPPPISST